MGKDNATKQSKKAKQDVEKSLDFVSTHKVVSEEEWLKARLVHLEKEKAFDKERDRLSEERRQLPFLKIEKKYVFKNPDGTEESLSDLFDGRSQLIVYHFMFGEDWDAGCKSCSYLADHFDGMRIHLANRDISFVVVSKASPAKLEAYKKRMGWTFKWLSSQDSTFNEDFNVSFTQDDVDNSAVTYNYKSKTSFSMTEAPGTSVFAKDMMKDVVYHTYSTYGRGLDKLIGAYHFMDMTPKGRDEDGLAYTMEWLRRHDEYDT